MPYEKSITDKLISKFEWAFQNLKISVPNDTILGMSKLIQEAMGMRSRSFHTPNHIFEVSENASPLPTLAAFYHDLVYFQVDEEFPESIWSRISPYIETRSTELWLREKGFNENSKAQVLLGVFGLKANSPLADFNGPNELLSSIVAFSELSPWLNETQLATVFSCIESTIPFRKKNSLGLSSIEALALRLKRINQERKWNLPQEEIDLILKMSVDLGNKDIENFATEDSGEFLDNTWKLMPESNPNLRAPELYTIKDYRIALEKMLAFLTHLQPDSIFHSYLNHPPKNMIENWLGATEKNIFTSLSYVRAKLYTIAIIEAFANLTGGNTPIVYLMGDLGKAQLNLHNPLVPRANWKIASDINQTTLDLLEFGRKTEIWFDLKNSPIAAYIYAHLGDQEILNGLGQAEQLFRNKISAEHFLESIDPELCSKVAITCSKTAKSRGPALEKLAQRLLQAKTKKTA